jgi:superfamily I DNA/RNA helicase
MPRDVASYIFRENCLTISTVHGAKGYDAYVVFLAGVDTFQEDEPGRASLYVGATRAKLVLYVTGLNAHLLTEARQLVARARALKANE